MTSYIQQKLTDLADESYLQYERVTGSILPRNPDGSWDFSNGAFRNNDVDAFRHAYVSGKLTQDYRANFADILGIANELNHWSDKNERNMDLWNNNIGRSYGSRTTSSNDLADLIKIGLDNNQLIVSLSDPRKYPSGTDLIPLLATIPQDLMNLLNDYFKDSLNNLIEKAKTISTTLLSAYTQFKTSVNTVFVKIKDPLIIDGGNDGLELNSWQNSGVLFDLDGDGNAESSGWVKSSASGGDELFLALDKNGNGNIDSVEELFGNDTTGGFAQLSAYDSNHDNIINSSDNQFNLLKIWKDNNGNGIVDSGEINSLINHNITSISLNTSNYSTTINGNNVTKVANVNFADGSTKKIYEVWFGSNEFNSAIANPDVALGADFELNLEVLTQPFSRGYGQLSSWQIAMSEDVELLNLSKQINNLTPNQFNQIDDLFSQFLFRWADVEDATNVSVYNGSNTGFDPRKMAFLEKITCLDFNYTTQDAIPLAVTAWNSFYNSLLNRFLIQGTLSEIFPNAHYDFETDALTINNTLDEVISNILSLSSQMDESSFLNYAYYAQNILQLNRDQFNDINFDSKVSAAITSIINSASIEGFQFNGVFNIGDVGDNSLFGGTGNDVLKGLEGNDVIYGDNGNDYIEGGKGNDQLKGGNGNDIYKFNLGDGIDVIEDGAGTDKIIFGQNINLSHLTFARISNDLVISIGINGDQIGIKNFYSATVNRVENIVFEDGSQFSLVNLGNIIIGNDFSETINGSSGNDIINAGGGNDTINSGTGDDKIIGGKGNDVINGNDGNDVYIFNVGDGVDTINETYGIDKIIFGNGITKSDINLVPNNSNLIIKIGNNGDQITVNSFFSNGYKIETLQFADGSLMDLSLGLTLNGDNASGETINATFYDDVINGNIGNDIINSGTGNDVIIGGKGNDFIIDNDGSDTYIFSVGDGVDRINDSSGIDKIIFGNGILKNDIILVPNNYNLIVKIGNNGDQITIENFFYPSSYSYKIETLQFADGSLMDLSLGLNLNGTNSSGETIYATSYDDVINGSSGNDIINSGSGNDIINGGDGNDNINGGTGNNVMSGGKGNDFIVSDVGDDVYIFNIGDGVDRINDLYGIDKIIFGNGILKNDIILVPNNYNLIVKIGNNGDQITIENFFYPSSYSYKIETLQFADGSAIDLSLGLTLNGSNTGGETIYATLYDDLINGGNGNDIINARSGNDVINGGDGNDTLNGGTGNNVMSGGKGNDFIVSDVGNDVYIFNIGDGVDRINDLYGIDKIIFGNGILKNDITLVPNNYNLIVKIGNSDDQITIENFFYPSSYSYKIETLQFSDGSKIDLSLGLDLNGVNTGGETIYATSYDDIINGNIGNDTISAGYGNDMINGGNGIDNIYGEFGNDVITGGKGNDAINGSDGNDVYIFNIGDGVDTINDLSGVDKIIFGDGIVQGDITLVPNNSNLIIKIGNKGDQITINSFFSNGYKIETLQFVDGSTIDLSLGLALNGTNSSGETIYSTSYDDIINGNIGNDTISAGYGNDVINGGNGNDTIYGDAENDIITGGKGNDVINGGDGNDVYIFNIGDGVDTINDLYGIDKIIFGDGIVQGDITLVPNNSNLIIKIGNNGDQITINSFFSNGYKIETLQFVDGSKIDLSLGLTLNGINLSGETITATFYDDVINGNTGNDTIYGGYGNDIINGGDGNDTIYDDAGNDVMTGGKGNDTIYTGYSDSGNDVYIFNFGDGVDTINDSYGIDKIIFGNGITKSDIILFPNNSNLIIKIGNNGDQITINNYFSNGYKIETLQFFDGSLMDLFLGLTLNGTIQSGETIYATSYDDIINGNTGNDTINAGFGNDIIAGGKGNDLIVGGEGHDVYIFNIGDGADTIDDSSGTEKIIFGNGIVQTDILMEANGSNLVIKIASNGDQITINNFFSNNNYKIETLQFADGTTFNISSGINISGSAANDYIVGTPFNDALSGSNGDDYLYGSDGNDVLEGGNGNDSLRGGRNDDVYKFGSDFTNQSHKDNDLIYEEGGVDTILFSAGISRDSISMISDGTNLVISGQNITNIITIINFFSSSSNKIEFLEFSDGSKFNLTNISFSSPSDNVSYYVGNYAPVYEDKPAKIRFFSNDGNIINYSNIISLSAPNHGTAQVTSNGDIIYAAASNYNGNDSFVMTYRDSQNNIQTKTINIGVLPTNDAPVSQNFSAQTNEDNSVEISIVGKVDDIDGDALFISNVGNFNHGSAVVINNKIIYTPNANFYGQDSFTYQVSDGKGGFDTKTITVDVASINDKPVTQNDVANTLEDTGILISITNNDSDVEDGFFDGGKIKITQQPAHGTVQITTDGKLYYIPAQDYYGTDVIQYSITDSEILESNISQVNISIAFVNDAPKLIVSYQPTFNEDEVTIINPNDYFYDPEGDNFSVISAAATNGTISIVNGQISYLSNDNFNGIDTLTFTLKDQYGNSRVVNTTAQVKAVNDDPKAINDSFQLQEDQSLRLTILNNDSDIDDVLFSNNITYVSNPLNGSVVINQDGTITYTPNANFYGSDSFVYEITDSGGLTSQATVNLTINAVNDNPQATLISANVNENNVVILDVLAFASDVDGDNLAINSFTNPENGSVKIVENKLVYTPNSNYNGNDFISYTLKDSKGGFVTKTITINVASINDAPIINATISNQSAKSGNYFSFTIPANSFSDIDGDVLTYSAKLSDGSELPEWLIFDSLSKTFSGNIPSGNSGLIELILIASDGEFSVSQNFNLDISSNQIRGTTGNDALIGTISNDVIFGESGSDLLSGGAGDDILNYSNDKNWSKGFVAFNTGSPDAVDFSGQMITIAPRIGNADGFDGGEGIDTIQMSDASEAIFLDDRYSSNPFGNNTARIRNVEVINAGGGDDIVDLTSNQFSYEDITINGDEGNDVLWSSSGNDVINGGEGNDNIDGGTGKDILNGDDGDDIIYGKSGNDIIIGGNGQDKLFGGLGNDIFKYNQYEDSSINASDLIKDFTSGEDKINLTELNLSNHLITFDSNPDDGIPEGLSYHFDNNNNTVVEYHNDNQDHEFAIKLQGQINLGNTDFEF